MIMALVHDSADVTRTMGRFLEQVESDTQLQEKLKEVTTPKAYIAIAKAAGFSITADDI